MKLKHALARTTLAVSLSVAAVAANAVPAGPVFSAPGGNTTVSSGSALGIGTRTFTYSVFNPSFYSNLWWGPSSNTAVGIAMDGAIDIGSEFIHLVQTVTGHAEGFGLTSFNTLGGPVVAQTVFTLDIFDSSNNPIALVTGGSLGLSPDVLAQVDAAALAGGFHVNLFAGARTNGTLGAFIPVNAYFDSFSGHLGGGTVSSFNGGFFSDPPAAVPEPGDLSLMGIAMVIGGLTWRRRASKWIERKFMRLADVPSFFSYLFCAQR